MKRYRIDCFDSIVEAKDPADGYLYDCDEVDAVVSALVAENETLGAEIDKVLSISSGLLSDARDMAKLIKEVAGKWNVNQNSPLADVLDIARKYQGGE